MKPSAKFPELLDLSFLSADEEAAILKVLQRDEELRKFDTGRQRRLKATTPDPKQVRVMTGEWFEDLKTKRYGQPCDITAVVKSSMRRKRTPAPKINPFMTYTATEARGDSKPEDPPDPTVQLGNGNYKIPAIVVMPSEQASGIKEGGSQSEATKGIIASNAEWEDEGLDSGDDQSSVSSYGSELSGRKSHLSNALSAGRMGSLMSIYSDAGDYGNVLVQGAVEFAMMYSPAEELIIMVEQCQDLAYGSARKQRTDPYVKTYLLPDRFRRTKRKTSIKKNTNSPVYVESLRYKIKKKDLMDKMLHLSVWHNDSRGRNVFLGQVELNLKTWDWGHEALTWYNLQAKGGEGQESQDYRGTLFVALKYTPAVSTGGSKQNTGEVHVWLKEAKDLCQLKSNSVDSFVKCYMLPDTSKKSRQKTRVVKKSLSPVYNHAMVFDGFRAGEVREACCELTVWEHHKLSNQFLGGLRLSAGTGESYGKQVDWMDSVNQEVEIWEQMLAKPNNWVEAVIPLRSSMTPRK
ncbi:synaptotagmin-like protein 2 isoform X6 [Alosa alosa]|uniref:synaptotagmin-like protein 2 isoform X6 n=1 Tax=Alosa alosa TaxID=278164 RepID=UPI00201506E4|nr:synaptotagmin-like protein 2 isoform X6 [Alosa alosa]